MDYSGPSQRTLKTKVRTADFCFITTEKGKKIMEIVLLNARKYEL